MILTQRYHLKLTNQQTQDILLIMKECARLWNDLIKVCVEYQQDNKKITAPNLQKEVQSKYNLHSDIITALCQRIDSNRKTALALRQQGIKCEFPYKIKELVTITGKKRQILKNNILSLSKDIKISIPEHIDLNTNLFHIVNRKNSFYICVTEYRQEQPRISSGVVCGVDLGEIHCIASTDTQGNKYLFSGRELRSYKRYRNRVLKYTAIRKKKLKDGSRKHKQIQKLRDRTSLKTKNKNRNYLHHVTKKFVDKCVQNNVSTVIVGDCTGVGQNTKQEKRTSRMNRQKLSQFECGTLMTYLRYKCELVGIQYKEVEEYWTTQTCPACGCLNKPVGRVYLCSDCGYEGHRDMVGSFNILRKVEPGVEVQLLGGRVVGILGLSNDKYRENSSRRSSGLEPHVHSEHVWLNA